MEPSYDNYTKLTIGRPYHNHRCRLLFRDHKNTMEWIEYVVY